MNELIMDYMMHNPDSGNIQLVKQRLYPLQQLGQMLL